MLVNRGGARSSTLSLHKTKTSELWGKTVNFSPSPHAEEMGDLKHGKFCFLVHYRKIDLVDSKEDARSNTGGGGIGSSC